MQSASELLGYLSYLLPSIIVGVIAFYFFKTFVDHQKEMQYMELRKENRSEVLPLRLQAFERLVLFLERISPGQLLSRIKPVGENKYDYENLLIASIEQEFEHNLVQQVYVSQKCWDAIKASKNSTISLIRKTAMSDKITSAQKLREVVLTELFEKSSPSDTGIAFLKNEIRQLF
ncbi:hypothetical protein pgond44_02518 [Psychroflexus gondwanensis ACAM 44]|jgi:hypothetical protein|uniref:Uncharacterized protein n=1 Tax=Psychroflexus gondwanensis ACAM 44 TaxID=1189619 RepID=N1WP59_9FLAO|nr:hypothetical protein [Psychroflexus gondwanensis]EMY82076.1 hypothetical protein pgond44_02518 [Psychroflexus gondwanensis ACAM 44]